MMLQLSMSLVFALNMLGAHSKAQLNDPLGSFSLGSDASAPIGNCICTPFYNCHDEETSSILNEFVDDRSANLPNLPVVTVRQEGLNDCPDVLDVCCHNLIRPSDNTKPPAQRPQAALSPQIPVQAQAPEPAVLLANMPTSCTDDHTLVSPGATCGVRNRCGVDFAVSGFKDGQAQHGEFPWMAAVLTSNIGGHGEAQGAKNLYVGGGSLIHPQVVLTAAHKVFENPNKTLTVRLGEWNFASTSETIAHQDIPVKESVTHWRYDSQRKSFNIALLVLERPAKLGETVGTVCLASNPLQRFDGHQDCIVSGWGKDVYGDTGRYQRILKSLSVNILDRTKGKDVCQSALQSSRLGSDLGLQGTKLELNLGFICAGDQGTDACTGDGGSPLVCPDPTFPGQYVQVGVTAWGKGCGEIGVPGVYWGVTPMMDWIDEELQKLKNENKING